MTVAAWMLVVAALLGQQPSTPSLDFQFFRTKVQPIFLAKRPGHARCVSCHASSAQFRMHLEPLSGATTWNEEQSRKNFESVRRMVVPGSMKSKLLIHPLAEQAGGDFYHNGGKHWTSQNDPEWQTLAAWVRGDKAQGATASR